VEVVLQQDVQAVCQEVAKAMVIVVLVDVIN
jgi:hypothetical protein